MTQKLYKVKRDKFSKYLRSYGTERNEESYFSMLHYSLETGYAKLEAVSYKMIDNLWRVPFRETPRLNTADKVIKRFFIELEEKDNG